MPENNIKDKLDELYKGVSRDIHTAEECLYLEEKIGEYASEINKEGFGNLFGNLQAILLDNARLKICRIFEEEKGNYPLRSIPAILCFMEKYRGALVVQNKNSIVKILGELGADPTILGSKDQNKPEFTDECVSFLLSILSHSSITTPLDAIKDARDKYIAHHEDIETTKLKAHTYNEMDELIQLSKKVISVVTKGYLNVNFVSTSKRSSNSLERLLKMSGVVK